MNHYQKYLKEKRERKLRWLFLIIYVLFFIIVAAFVSSCKKKKVDPIPDPIPVCQTGMTKFDGNYYSSFDKSYTMSIEFVKNNCPTENSNIYLIKGLSQIMQLYAKPNTTIAIQDYTVSSDEPNLTAYTQSPITINLKVKQEGGTSITVLTVSSSKTKSDFTINQLK